MISSIFLHYLDRELLQSIGYPVDINKANLYTKILSLGTGSTLYANYSIIVEGNYLTNSKDDFIPLCVKYGTLKLIAEEFSFDEFIETRQSMYDFDRDRYEMYYKKPVSLEPYLHSNIMCDYDDIDNLTNHVYSWANDENKFPNDLLHKKDIHTLGNIQTNLVKILNKRENQALTSSFFEDSINTHHPDINLKNYKQPIARLLSSLYINDFLIFLSSTIPTGIYGISYFDNLENNFPYQDIPILATILKKIGLSRIIENNDARCNERVIKIINKNDHALFTNTIYDIVDYIYKEMKTDNSHKHVTRQKIIDRINRFKIVKKSGDNSTFIELMSNLEFIRKQLFSYNNYTTSIPELSFDKKYHLFMSHASNDKINIVNSLVNELEIYNLNIWYDSQKIYIGDSVVDKINNGILNVSNGFVVVLSKSYFSKPWCLAELRVLLHIHITTGIKIFPIRHNISHEYIMNKQSLLSDTLSFDSAIGAKLIASHINKSIHNSK